MGNIYRYRFLKESRFCFVFFLQCRESIWQKIRLSTPNFSLVNISVLVHLVCKEMGRSRISVSITFFRDSLNNYGSVRRLVALFLNGLPPFVFSRSITAFYWRFSQTASCWRWTRRYRRTTNPTSTNGLYVYRETLSLVHVCNTEC